MRIILAVVALGIAGAVGPARRSADREAAQVASIRAHFDTVLVELTSAPTTGLSFTQRWHRARLIETLRGYRAAGVFPHNYDFAEPTPQFIDRKTGTRCAMAFLIESTGERALVARVAHANNSVHIMQLASDTALGAWLERNGLSLDEAARIQPTYGGPDMIIAEEDPWTPARLAPVTLFASGAAIMLNTFGNRRGDKPVLTTLGYVAGVAGVFVGFLAIADLNDDGSTYTKHLGVGNVAVGVGSVIFSSIVHDIRKERLAAKTTVSVTPIVPTAKSGPGLAVALRF